MFSFWGQLQLWVPMELITITVTALGAARRGRRKEEELRKHDPNIKTQSSRRIEFSHLPGFYSVSRERRQELKFLLANA